MKKGNLFLLILVGLLIFGKIPFSFSQGASEIEIVFDLSRSMNDAMGGTTKLDAAKQALTTIANQIAPGANVGLRIFGTTPIQGNITESCADSILAMPISAFQKDSMISKILPLQSFGMTALGFSLEQAANDFSKSQDAKRSIILISDGEETCGKDPVAVMENLKALGIEITIHSIGFGASEAAKGQLKRLADVTNGTYREAEDAGSLQKSLEEVAQKEMLLTIQRGAGENILAASAGTRIVSSSTQEFAKMIDGKEDPAGAMYPGQEAVFSFKDNQAVLIEKFAVPIFQVGDYNPGDFKLSGSVEGPEIGFFPIANFKVVNKVFFGNVYQEFKIDPSQAVRYLKVTLGPGSNGAHSYHTEWKAYGKYLSDAELAEEIKKQGKREINIIAAEYGGQLIAASNMNFQYLIDGKSGDAGQSGQVEPNQEGIFGFRGGKTALITKVATPILEARTDNCKTIEFYASEKSPTGPYEKVGAFETTNMVFAGNPYQEYTFEKPVKTKYFKVKVIDTYGNWSCHFHELQAFGTLEE